MGRRVLALGSPHGGIISGTLREGGPAARARTEPPMVRPRPIRRFVGRESELASVLDALAARLPVEVCGIRGIGRTALLRHVAYAADLSRAYDGLFSCAVGRQTPADVLQAIYDACVERPPFFKTTDTEVRRALHRKRLLILVDDVAWRREELENFIDAVPECGVLAVTPERLLYDEAHAVTLGGLGREDALTLFERELGRDLTEAERGRASAACDAVAGHPMRVRQLAALLRHQPDALDEGGRASKGRADQKALGSAVLARLGTLERRVLLLLNALGGVPLHLRHLEALVERADLDAALRALEGRALVDVHQGRYAPASGFTELVTPTRPDAIRLLDRALEYFVETVRRARTEGSDQSDVIEALVEIQERAHAAERWPEVLVSGRAVATPLAIAGRWGVWAAVLDRHLRAARALEDKSAEAWALHETGTRALCLGQATTARLFLEEALARREALDDHGAIDASRRNLDVLSPVSVVGERAVLGPTAAVQPLFDVPPLTGMRTPERLRIAPERPAAAEPPPSAPRLSPAAAPAPAPEPSMFDEPVLRPVFAPSPSPDGGEALVDWGEDELDTDEGGDGAEDELADRESASGPAPVLPLPRGPNGADLPLAPCRPMLVEPHPPRRRVWWGLAALVGVAGVAGLVWWALGPARARATAPTSARILAFAPLQASVGPGIPVELCFEVIGATRAQIDQGVGELRLGETGCVAVSPGGTTVYTLTVSGIDGAQAEAQATVRVDGVAPAPSTPARPRADDGAPASLGGAPAAGVASSATTPAGAPMLASPSPLTFETLRVSRWSTRTIRLTSQADDRVPVVSTAIDSTFPDDFAIVRDECRGTSLGRGDACAVDVRFTARGEGPRTGLLLVEYGSGMRLAIPLEAAGTLVRPPTGARLDPPIVDFGVDDQPGAVRAISIRNTGDAALAITGMEIDGPHAAEFGVASSSCDQGPLASGAECTVQVRASPAGPGRRQARLVIWNTNTDGPYLVALSATGAAVERSDRSYD